MLALFSPPLLVKPLPAGVNAMPWTRGVSAIVPTTAFLSMSITTICVLFEMNRRRVPGSTAKIVVAALAADLDLGDLRVGSALRGEQRAREQRRGRECRECCACHVWAPRDE